jgi:hypothetical protein
MATKESTAKNKDVKEILSDEKFSLTNKSLHLSAEVREKELLCALLDKHNNSYIAFADIGIDNKSTSIEEALKNDILSTKAASISIAFAPNSSLLVPALFFKKELVNDYLGFQQLDKLNETPCFDFIKNLDSYNLYTVNNDILSTLSRHYPSASFRHTSSIFIEFLLTEHRHSEGSKVFVSVYHGYFDVVVLKAGKLILSNRFYYSNPSDFIYHLLWVYEQLELDNEKVSCVFYGDIESSTETFVISGKYIKKVSLGERNKQSTYATALAILPHHKYRSLFTQYLCV